MLLLHHCAQYLVVELLGGRHMVRSLDTAQEELGPLSGRLYDCVQRALRKFADQSPELKAEMRPTTIANLIHDFIRIELRREFPEGNGDEVRPVITKRNLFLVLVGDDYKIRVKKMRAGQRVSHIQTQSVMAFMQQGEQLELIASPTNLILGYQPRSAAELLTSAVWLVCPNGDEDSYWKMPILPDEAETSKVTPIGGMPPAEPAPSRVVAKEKPVLEEGEDGAEDNSRAKGKNDNEVS
jgi:hypothetical protein